MKKMFFILITLFAFLTICTSLKAQDVSFGYEKKIGDTFTAKVTCSKAATVKFEIQTSSSIQYGWANYRIHGINYESAYYTLYQPGKRIDYMTLNLPSGTSDIEITGYKCTAVILLSAINGKTATTRPIVTTFY